MSGTLMVSVSGVRGIVGTDLTPELVARYAAAFGTVIGEATGDAGRGRGRRPAVVLARDSRTSGVMFARAAAAGLLSVGCDVIDCGLVPTPTAQLAVRYHRAGGGLVLTASHNPVEWNALKFVGADGVFLDAASAARVPALAQEGRPLRRADWTGVGTVREDAAAIRRHVDTVIRRLGRGVARIRRRRFRVALDTCRGAGGAIMPDLLRRLGCRVVGINLETDGRFPRPPEPIPEHLAQLGARVRSGKAQLGMAVDPDVDRLAIVDDRGRPIGEDYTLAFAVRAVLGTGDRRRGTERGKGDGGSGKGAVVVCNLSTSLVVEDAAREHGATVVRVPVGEAHVAWAMREHGAAIGGEGNGGVIDPAVHLGRDGPLAAAHVLSLLAASGRSVSELVAAAPRYAIVKARAERRADLTPTYAALRAGFPDAEPDAQDGLRLAWPGRWLHVRPSGTEPIVRVIAEAPTAREAQALVERCLSSLR